MRGMLSSFGKPCILLVLSIAGGSNGVIISPGGAISKRNVISFANQTTEDRRLYLHGAQEKGHTCWILPDKQAAAVCVQNPTSIYTDLPESAEALRHTLAKVNLRAWLPSLLCPSPLAHNEAAITDSKKIDNTLCREAVEASLATQPYVEIILTSRNQGHLTTTIRASVDETPWIQAMQSLIGSHEADRIAHCSAVYAGLASQRAKLQLLPALRILADQKQTLSPAENNSASSASGTPTPIMNRTSFSPLPDGEKVTTNTEETIPTTTVLAEPSVKRIESLLSLLEGMNEKSSAMMSPSLRMMFPLPGGRLSGGVVAFIGEVTLGAALTARLRSANDNIAHNRGTERVPAERGRLSDDSGSSSGCAGGNCTDLGGHKRAMPPGPDFDLCVVRVIVDDKVASTIPIETAESVDDNGTIDTKARIVIKTAVVPSYKHKIRCSEHPAKETAAAAWSNDEFTWRLEARAIDKICTRETLGPHSIHGELACRRAINDENVAGNRGGVAGEEPATKFPEATPEPPPPRPEPEPSLHESQWEVMTTSAVVEYSHTGNLADVLSSSPSKVAAKTQHDDTLDEIGNPLFEAPPEDLSVSLYVEGDPENTLAVVAVPRWFSDGEVWEAAFNACLKTFGPSKGFMVNTNDCVDLVTNAIAAKRTDLYYTISLRLMAYLESINPNFYFEGHTGANPEKVEALGTITRKEGERVGTICEVGFNAGHSSLNWLLSSRPSTNILAFDLGEHDYMKHAVDFLQAVFPGRLDVVVGDSTVTVPAYATAEEMAGRDPRVCGMVFVDGDHSEGGAYADIVNFQALASRDWNVLAIDDLDDPPVEAAWRRYRGDGRGRLEHVVQATGGYFAHGWTTEDRRAYLQGAEEEGYTCWVPRGEQNPSSIYTDLPESAEALRHTLAKVNLRAWLPSLLCPSPLAYDEAAITDSKKIDNTLCRQAVEASLATQPHVEVILTPRYHDHLTTTSR